MAFMLVLGLGGSVLLAPTANAVEPAEMLADPALEARARALGRQIRCPVCQSETIEESDAAISHDLRIILRERLAAGDSDEEATDYLVARYGEFILYNPRRTGVNLVLWFAGPVALILAVGYALLVRRRRPAPVQDLSPEERARLRELLDE